MRMMPTELLQKAKRMPVGTISHGRKKVAEGKWVPVSKQKPSRVNELTAQFDTDEKLGITDTEDEGSVLPDGGSFGICTNSAEYVIKKVGGQMWGYDSEDNPDAQVGADEGGHDFAVVENRYIVDVWNHLFAGESERTVYDMHNKNDKAIITKLYGKPSKWSKVKSSMDREMNKSKKMPVGTISRGRKKVAEGRWVDIPKSRLSVQKKDRTSSQISRLIDEERKAGIQYPVAAAYENYYKAVKEAKGKTNILSVTKELDDFLKQGDKYSLRDNKLADSIRNKLFELLIQRRREVMPPYPTKKLEDFLSRIKKNIEVVYESKWDDLIKKDYSKREVFQYAESLVDLLKNPEVVGLYEESEFGTVRAEANSYISLLSKKAKKGVVFPFDELSYVAKLKTIVKEATSKPLGKSKTWSGYKIQGRTKFQGLPISIENERGTMRRGEDADGHEWATFMHIPYGYIRLTEGTDGDHVDCYLGTSVDSEAVFVVHQNDPNTGKYDEDKVMLGFRTAREAKKAYIRQYDRPGFFGSMDQISMVAFKTLLHKRYGGKLVKALVPIKVPVSRRGKTFMQTFWVSPKQAKQEAESQQAVAAEAIKPRVARNPKSTTFIMGAEKAMYYAPEAMIGVEKVMALQQATFGDSPMPSIEDVRETAAQELEWALTQEGETGEGWYSEKIMETRAILTQAIPSLADDTEWDFFSAILALTSPRVNVSLNMDTAVKVYCIYKQTGTLPTKQPSGKHWAGPNAEKVLTRVNNMIKERGGIEGFTTWMKRGSLGKNLKTINPSFTGSLKEFHPNAKLFGPKVGAFYNNLIGEFSLSTIDTWAARSWQRWNNNVRRFQNSMGDFEVDVRLSTRDKKNVDALFTSLSKEFDMSKADVQAVLWYYEKRLYAKIGVKKSLSEDIGYDEAAKRVYNSITTGSREASKAFIEEWKDAELLKGRSSDVEGDRAMNPELRTPGGIKEGTLIKSDDGSWYAVVEGHWTPFHVYIAGQVILEKAVKVKSHYSSEEVKARGMRWVTIRGARVLLQGTSDGGWVVVGGAGGKLNHMKIDKILGKEEYARKREEQQRVVKERKKELRSLTAEEMKQQRAKRKVEVEAKRGLRAQYEARVKEIMGAPEEDFKSKVTGQMMDEITDQARDIVETRKRKILDVGDEKDIEREKEKIVQQEVNKEIKNVERRALDALMSDYADETDPNSKKGLKQLIDKQKAMEILRARKEFRQAVKAVGVTAGDPKKPRLKMGDVFAASSKSLDAEIMEEVKQNRETAGNIALYDRMNAQSRAINKYVSQGNASAINGIMGDVFKTGAPFSPVMFNELGVDAVARITAMYVRESGKTKQVKDALEKFSAAKREKTVSEALSNADERLSTADELRNMAKGLGDDAEGLMSMAQANGYALKEMIAAQQELGTAVGSLQAMAHLINALEEPSADAVLVDMGTNLSRARDRAKKAGLQKGSYNIRKKKGGGKRLMMEVPRESIAALISNIQEAKTSESKIERIKMHKENDGYTPPGMNKNATHPITKVKGPIKLDAAQEAGLHFFREQGKVLLDFEAGLGKTAVAYAAAMEAIHNKGAKKVLVVTPAKLRDQFAEESSVFLDEENRKLVKSTGSMGPKKRREVYGDEKGIHVIGHDTLSSDWQAIKDAGYDMIVIDEMHELTPQGKGKGSQRFRGMMQLTDIPLKIGMSGTNIKNSKTELHRKVAFIDPDHTLGSISAFEKRYKGLNQGTSAFHESANDAFRKEISPWMYTQCNHLAVKHTSHKERVALTAIQRTNVRDIMKTYMKEKEAKAIGAAARRDANLYRVVHDDAFAHNSKAGRIVDIMNETHSGEKAIIHVTGIESLKSTKQRLESEFGAGTVAVIMGEGPESAVSAIRQAKKDFNNPDSPIKFIIGTKSMESGHNLQGGTVVFHLDQADTYASMDQRVKRSYRRGQDRDVTSYTLSGMNPLDLRKEDLIKRKKREMGILGNSQEIEGMDGTGFLAYLNLAEKEAGYGKQTIPA